METGELNLGCGPCVYFLWDGDTIVYIGKTKDVQQRVRSHKQRGISFSRVTFTATTTVREASVLEIKMIQEHRPILNKWHYTKGERVQPPESCLRKRINISIQERLHVMAKSRASDLKLSGGFSGYLERLIKIDVQQQRKRLDSVSRDPDAT